jgi:hypothetical protein
VSCFACWPLMIALPLGGLEPHEAAMSGRQTTAASTVAAAPFLIFI